VKVHEEKDELFTIGIGRTKDKKFLILGSQSTDTWDQWILPAAKPRGKFQPVLPREKGHKYAVEHRNGVLYLRTKQGRKKLPPRDRAALRSVSGALENVGGTSRGRLAR
jgi:oligopeptidase B